jgi:hypothetical protein
MGTYSKNKHYSERGRTGGEGSSSGDHQRKVTSYSISKADVNSFLIPILKEIGKCIYPPAAPLIEAAYQVYKHIDTIKEASSAVVKGDYEKATKVVLKEAGKEAGGAIVGAMVNHEVDKGAELAGETVSNSLPTNEQGKDLAGKVVKGTGKGFAEAVGDKVVDKAEDEVSKDET